MGVPKFYFAAGAGVVGLIAFIVLKDRPTSGSKYELCLKMDAANEMQKAWDACTDAMKEEMGSDRERAAAKLREPKYVAWKKAEEARSGTNTQTGGSLPATVTREWCGELGMHVEPRLKSEAEAKFPNSGASDKVHDYVLNMVHNCVEDVGNPISERWRCHWNETFDTTDNCKSLDDEARRERRKRAQARDE